MNKLILCLCLTMAITQASAQKIFFVYLQSENEQPFYVKFRDKMHSSTASGYLIIPRLRDSSYSISIGFPQNKWPEQHFNITVNNKDLGFMLKNYADKGWALVDLQTQAIQMSIGGRSAMQNKPEPSSLDVSPFTEVLARASDDPSLREKPVRPKPEEKKEVAVVTEPVKTDIPGTDLNEIGKETAKATDVKATEKEPVKKAKDSGKKIKETGKEVAKITKETTKEKKEEDKYILEATGSAVIISAEPIAKTAETNQIPVAKKEEPKAEPVVETIPEKTETVVAKKEEPKAEPVVEVIAEKTEPIIEKKAEIKETVVEPVAVKTETADTYQRSEIVKATEAAEPGGQGIVFIDNNNGKTDTIRLLIPNPKPVVEPIADLPKTDKKFLEINPETDSRPGVKNETTEPVKKDEQVNTESGIVAEKKEEVKQSVAEPVAKRTPVTDCSDPATESEFLKVHRKMSAASDYEEMVTEARKYLKGKCFTVYQLRNLSALFLTDEGKYKFFDEAYSHASDSHNFISLQLELKDEYYIKRFKAMLK